MHLRRSPALVVVLLLLCTACASSPRVRVPPRVDLASYGTVGLVRFDSTRSPELAELATHEFLSTLHQAQPGVPILELGSSAQVLRGAQPGPVAIRALGREHHVDAVILGDLVTQDVRPSLALHSLTSVRAKAVVKGTLRVRILDAHSGATRWTRTSQAEENVAQLSLANGRDPRLRGRDPAEAESRLVHQLVRGLSGDFFWSWQ